MRCWAHIVQSAPIIDVYKRQPSVLKRTVKPYATVQRTSVETIARLCIGLEIPFKEFWDSPIFDEITTKQQEAESK